MAFWQCRACKGPPIEGGSREKPWVGPCPHCGRFANAIKLGENAIDPQHQKLFGTTAASSGEEKYKVKRIPTGVEPLDHCLSGGVSLSQSIMFAGPPGSRKSSVTALALQGLTKHTDRHMLYISAEQNKAAVLGLVFGLNGVTANKIVLHASDEWDNSNIDDILDRCNQIKPFACAFDSLQAINQSVEAVSHKITDYCQRTKMIGFMISQLTKDGDFKGGTGSSYFCDTLLLYEPYRPSIDGDPIKRFGADVAEKIIRYNSEMRARDAIEELRVLVGGAFGKNRFGTMNQKAYILTQPSGEMLHLREKAQ